VDVSHLLHIGGGIISWIVNAGDVAQYTLVLEDCAGNTASIPLNFTTVAVPADVDFGLDGQAGPDFAGATVRITNGNVLEARGDLSLPSPNQLGLGFEAFYNSRNAAISTLGRGWSHTYSVALSQPYIGGAAFIRIADATGRARYFSAVAPYAGAFGEKSQLFYLNGQYVWQRLDGARFGFESSGRLAWMDDPIGNRLQLAYSGGVMSSVTDTASGRALTFDYATYYSGGWKYILSSVSGPATAAVPDGIWVRFGYDNSQNLTEVTYADGSGIRYAYDEAAGNLTGKRNVAGHQLAAWQYDTQDRVVESQLADDAGVRLTYLDPERVQVSDAYGIERTYRLAQIHGRTKVTALESGPAAAPYGADAAVRWQYDDQLNLTEVEYAGGTAESPANTLQRFENFDARGNPGTVIQAWNTPEARTATYTYHPVRNTVLTRVEQSVLDPAQDKTTLFDYDDPAAPGDDPLIYNQNPGRLVRRVIEMGLTRTVGGAMEPYTYVTALTHNTKGQLLASDGPLEGSQDTTTYEYDPISGDLAVVTRPLVGSTTYAQYNAAGRPGTITDVNHVVKAMTYDGRGRTIEIVNQADHGRQSFIYQNGLLTQTIDPDGITRAFAYETQRGWLETISDHQGHTTVYQYDEQGNRIGQLRYDADDPATPAASAFWSYTHPELPGRLFREYSPDPNRPGQEVYSQYDYDRAGNIASATDPKGNTTAYVYDSLNRVIESNAPGAVTTYMAYDRHGNLSVVTDAEGRHTVHQYDDMGRLVSESSPDAGTTTYAYDAAGNRTHSLDGRGVAASYSPDALGRTQRIDYPAFDGQSAWSIVYSYDEGPGGKGRMTGMQDASGRTTWDYNRLDDQGVIAKTTVIENFSYDFSQSQTPGGRVTQMTYPSGRTVDYQRAECACEISGVTTTFNGQATILAADLAYRLSGMPKAMDLGNTGTANVDNRYDEAGRLTAANPDTPNAQTYRHDANGNVVNIKLEAAPWQSQTYSYDTLDRVTGAIGDFGFLDFSYDKTGNRLTRTHNGAQSVYSYASGTSRLTRITTDGVPIALTHDGHGNTTTNGSRRYTYDPANQLVRVDDTDLVAQYVYNGLGQRVIKSVNGQSTYYHYDLAGHLIAETPAGGLVSAGTEHINKGNGLLSQVDVKTGAIYGYHTNYLGAVHQLTDINGTIVWEAVYQPFGETVINAGSTVVNNWRMPGQYFDAETGLHYNYFRYYDAATGRYLTPDPIGLEGGINLYAYSLDNPVLFIDPYGLDIRTPKWAVKGFINNGKGLVSSVSNNAFSEEEMNRIIDKIWEVGSDPLMVSFGKYQPLTDPFTKQVNAFQLTKNQFEIVEEIMKRLGQKYPDDPLVKKAMEEWGKAKDKWIFHEKDGLRYCIKVLQREGEEYPCPSAVK
jgi:RHS repeat-associated protein